MHSQFWWLPACASRSQGVNEQNSPLAQKHFLKANKMMGFYLANCHWLLAIKQYHKQQKNYAECNLTPSPEFTFTVTAID